MVTSESRQGFVGFAYSSQAVPALPQAAILRLALLAAVFNRENAVTGLLAFENGRFSQEVEGDASVILPLAARIMADPRHRALRIERFGLLSARRWASWTASGIAGFEPPVDAAPGRILPFAGRDAIVRLGPAQPAVRGGVSS